jgi:hypothetical protein
MHSKDFKQGWTKRQASKVMNNLTKREISVEENPMGVAATVLYIKY